MWKAAGSMKTGSNDFTGEGQERYKGNRIMKTNDEMNNKIEELKDEELKDDELKNVAGGQTWLKDEEQGEDTTGAWYGLGNEGDKFEHGSRFWVRWIDEHDDNHSADPSFTDVKD